MRRERGGGGSGVMCMWCEEGEGRRRERGGGGSGVMCMWCEEGEGRRREWCDVHVV